MKQLAIIDDDPEILNEIKDDLIKYKILNNG